MTRTTIHSSIGPRENLEDTALACLVVGPGGSHAPLVAVCDGAGAQNHSKVASTLAQSQIQSTLVAHLATGQCDPAAVDPDKLAGVVRESLVETNQLIVDQANQHPDLAGMATTVVCGVIVDGTLIIGWVGDSRCYISTDGQLRRLTRDHTRVEELVALGLVSREDARSHPAAHTITRYLGQRDNFEPELGAVPVSTGDVILMCTDGLTDVLTDEDIKESIRAYKHGTVPFDLLAEHLVDHALRAGTHDNTTVLCCEYDAGTSEPVISARRTSTGEYTQSVMRVLEHLHKEETHEPNRIATPVAAA